MGTKPGTVKSRVSRARAELEELMNGAQELADCPTVHAQSAREIAEAFDRGAAA